MKFRINSPKTIHFHFRRDPPNFIKKISPKKPLGKGPPEELFLNISGHSCPRPLLASNSSLKSYKIDLICKIYENLKKTLGFYYIFKLKLIKIYENLKKTLGFYYFFNIHLTKIYENLKKTIGF